MQFAESKRRVCLYRLRLKHGERAIRSDANTLTLLQNCATAPNYAFVSPTASQLQTIFSQIGDSLSNLRVSK